MTTPYDPETGEWTVFADPRPDRTPPDGKAVFHKPGQRPFSTPTQILLWGDTKRAESYYPQAAQMLAQANFDTAETGEFFKRERVLGNGVRYKCRRDLYQDFIEIEAKPKPVPPGPMHLNFDANGSKYFADSTLSDKVNGMPLYFVDSMEASVNYNCVVPQLVNVNGLSGIGIVKDSAESKDYAYGAVKFNQKSVTNYAASLFVASLKAGEGNELASINVRGKRFLLSLNCWGDGRWTINTDSGYYSVSSGYSDAKLLVGQRCFPTGKAIDGRPEVFYRTYLNGEQIMESPPFPANIWWTWGPFGTPFGYDSQDYLVLDMMCRESKSHAALHQLIYLNNTMADTAFDKLTDELAAKWGF